MKTKFWTYSGGPLKIDPERLMDFLNEEGIYKFVPPKTKTHILVKIENNKVKHVSSSEIRVYCWKYVKENDELEEDERNQALSQIYKNTSLFNKWNMNLLQQIELKEVRDTSEKSYLFFNNIVLEITIDNVKKLQYNELDGHVFEADIIDMNFDHEFIENEKPDGEFWLFLQDISRHPQKETEAKNLESLFTIIGYLLHRYKDPANAKAIILMDSYKDGTPNGGTGKGLLTKAFENVRSYEHVDGKFYKNSDKFALSSITYGTRVFTFDDVPEDFNFEKIFPLITEKAVVERKFENKFSIPFEDSPKVVITTNYTVDGKGDSHKRRKVEFIVSDTYSAEFSPEDKFGHLLYVNWSKVEWQKFYKTIILSIQAFLLMGLVKPKFNVAERRLKLETSKQFIDFVDAHDDIIGVKTNKKVLYEEFYSKYPDHYRIELNTFTKWLKLAAEAYGFGFYESHSGDELFFEFTGD